MSISNQRIYDYYQSNPLVNFEYMNLLIIDLLDKMSQDIAPISTRVLNEVKEIQMSIKESHTLFLEKIIVGSKDDELVTKLVETFGTTLLPQTEERVKIGCQTDFVSTMDTKLSLLQQPLFQMIQTNQDQLSTRLSSVRDDLLSNKASNDRLYEEMTDFLHKYKASSQFKGQYSENRLEITLTEMYPTGTIENTTAQSASGDFMVHREGFPSVLIENKNYVRNVDLEEIKKFLRDVTNKNCSGIMISQFSGIVSKPNLFIDIQNGHVLVYLHRVQFSKEQIKLAMDIIDNLSSRLSNIVSQEDNDGVVIHKHVLDKINEDLQQFIKSKESMAALIRNTQKKLLSQLDELQLPELSLFMNDKYASIQHQEFICDTCGFKCASKRGLGNHNKVHKVNTKVVP